MRSSIVFDVFSEFGFVNEPYTISYVGPKENIQRIVDKLITMDWRIAEYNTPTDYLMVHDDTCMVNRVYQDDGEITHFWGGSEAGKL